MPAAKKVAKKVAKKSSAKPAKKAPAKKVAKKAVKPAKKAPAKKAAKPAKKVVAKKAPAKKAAKPAKKVVAKKAPAKKVAEKPVKKVEPKKVAPAKAAAPAKAPAKPEPPKMPPMPPRKPKPEPPKRPVIEKREKKDGIQTTKEFDLKFLLGQRSLLHTTREELLGQAVRLEDEAHQLIEDAEMGDVQFDDEGGEGDTMVVERERDLALSASARETIEAIDAALARMKDGTYGYSVVSGFPIPRERLKALPWATELVQEKVGGIGRR